MSQVPQRHPAAGVALIICALLASGLMAAHPSISAGDLAGAFAEAAHEARIAKFVHGMFIALFVVWSFGHTGLAQRLGLQRPLVLGGLIAYVLAAGAGVGAGVINGLVFPEFATRFADASTAQMETAHTVMAFGSRVSGVLAQICVLGWSTAVAAWSLTLIPLGGAWRWGGVFGIIIGAGISIALLAGYLKLDVLGFGAFVLVQSIWSVWIGIQLTRSRPA